MMIYIDLDGCCADFNKKVLELTGTGYNAKETWKVLEKYLRLRLTSIQVLRHNALLINKGG